MKKALSLTVLLALLLALLTSCSTVNYKGIKALKIEDVTCTSFYLYAFDEAIISGYLDYGAEYPPTVTGYAFSFERLEVGDEIEVWTNHSFSYYDEFYNYTTRQGTTGKVTEIAGDYSVGLLRSGNSYTVTFFGHKGTAVYTATFSSLEQVTEVEKYKVEVITDNPVYIEFEA